MAASRSAFLLRRIRQPRRAFSCASSPGQKHAFKGNVGACDFDVVVVGGGIVGLATAREMLIRKPYLKMALLEKECRLATHASTRNSGVIHAGIYYQPGSNKAKFCVEGNELVYKYCEDKKIPHKRRGKIIVARNQEESKRLEGLIERATENKVPDITVLDACGIKKVEPFCRGCRALYAPSSGCVDWATVALSFAEDFKCSGGRILTGFEVEGFCSNLTGNECRRKKYPVSLFGHEKCVNTRYAVVCAGLYADRLARMTGGQREPAIVPIRGKYYMLKPSAACYVRGNIYPVPDPKVPFLGVHFTRRVDGTVFVGPDAIIATSREGYSPWNFRCKDVWEMATYGGFWRMCRQHWREGARAAGRALSRRPLLRDVQGYVPQLRSSDLVGALSGVRAQPLDHCGGLGGDFAFELRPQEGPEYEISRRVLHCRAAPSPAATACLALGRALAERAEQEFFEKRSPASSPATPDSPPHLTPRHT